MLHKGIKGKIISFSLETNKKKNYMNKKVILKFIKLTILLKYLQKSPFLHLLAVKVVTICN